MDKIVVCACTYKRHAGLRALFQSFEMLETDPQMDVRFVVVDNDETPSSKELFEELAAKLAWPATYAHEPVPGIPSARNRAIKEAGSDGYMVFVDDDETVAKDWLVNLWQAVKSTGGAFVQGPCEMRVEAEADAWWLDTLFFAQKDTPDGARIHESWTNNVIISLDFITQNNCRFDEKLSFDGGSDTLFFQDIVRAGGAGYFAANAWVSEIQPKSRLTWKWALNRQYRYGVTRANTAILRKPRVQALGYCVYRGFGMIAVGAGHILSAVFRGKTGLANGAALFARASGIFMGGLGFRKLEYAR